MRLAEHEWAAYRAHPWLVRVMASTRPPMVPAVLGHSRSIVEAFQLLGCDSATALGRYLALSGYVQGMAQLLTSEQEENLRSSTSYPAWWRAELRRLDRIGQTRRHPWLDDVSGPGPGRSFDVDTAFRDALRRIVAGLVADEGE